MSDLHLQIGMMYGLFDVPVRAPYLLLAGNIGRLQDYDQYCMFLQQCCAKYARVFLVLGQQEFFGVTREEGLELVQQLAYEPVLSQKLTILDQTRFDINDRITILGCTLQPRLSVEVARQIREKDPKVRHFATHVIEAQNCEHEQDVSWLQHQLRCLNHEGTNRMVIVATHHAPSFSPSTRMDKKSSIWSPEFCSRFLLGEAEDWDGLDRVGFWVFGHTHWNVHKRVGEFLDVVSNQRGHVLHGAKQQKLPSSRDSHTRHMPKRSFSVRRKEAPGLTSSLRSAAASMDFSFNVEKVLDLSDAVQRLDKALRSRGPRCVY